MTRARVKSGRIMIKCPPPWLQDRTSPTSTSKTGKNGKKAQFHPSRLFSMLVKPSK